MMPFEPRTTKVQVVEEELRSRELINRLVRQNSKEAQKKTKLYVDKHMTDHEFLVRDKVYLRLHPYHQMPVVMRRNLKLAM